MKICFVTDKFPRYRVGGAERQCFEIGKELASRGHEIHMTTRRFSRNQPERKKFDGVHVHTFGPHENGDSTIRSFLSKRADFLRLLYHLNCDIYHNTPPSPLTGWTAVYCSLFDKPFTFSLAHTQDYDPSYWASKSFRRRWLYKFGLHQADARIALARYMQEGLRDSYGLNSHIIPIGHPQPSPSIDFSQKERKVIWMARLVEWKNPEEFIELARRVDAPNYSFHLIGDSDDPTYRKNLEELASDIPNIHFEGWVESGNDTDWFRKSRLFIDTSESTGFSNTFIQAWLHRVPVASLHVDPDNYIERMDAGVTPCPFDNFVERVQTLLNKPTKLKSLSENTKFADKEFSIEVITNQYEDIFTEVTESKE